MIRWFLALVVGVLFLLLAVPPERDITVSAENEGLWSNGLQLVDKTEEVYLESEKQTCDETEMQAVRNRRSYTNKSYAQLLLENRTVVAPKLYKTCIVENKLGVFGDGVWSPSGNLKDSIEISPDIVAAPTSNVVIHKSYFGSDPYGSFRISINYNFEAIGRLEPTWSGSGVNTTYGKKWTLLSPAPSLTYSNGSPVLVYELSFSQNGRFAVALLSSGQVVQINLETQEITPLTMFAGAKRAKLAVSNDGMYVSGFAAAVQSSINMYDLKNCENKYSKGLFPILSFGHEGCESTAVYGDINSQLAAGNYTLIRLEFNPGASLRVDTLHFYEGKFLKFIMNFKPVGYTSSARGYLAMGDSFSSGEGDTQGGTWYEPGTDEQGDKSTFAGRNLCHLSRRSYPYLIAKQLDYLDGVSTEPVTPSPNGLFHSVACSGAKIHNVIGAVGEKQDNGAAVDFAITDNQYRFDFISSLANWQPGFEKQVGYIVGRNDNTVENRLPFSPEVITVGVGGNDAGFGKRLASCLGLSNCEYVTNESKRAQLITELAAQKSRLEQTYLKLKQEAPEARVYAIGYPQFVHYPVVDCANNVRLGAPEVRFIHEAVDYFNQVIQAAALSSGVQFIDVEDTLEGGNLCSGASDSDMLVNGITAGNDIDKEVIFGIGWCSPNSGCLGSETYHPNHKAQDFYKRAILSQTLDFVRPNTEPTPVAVPLPSDYFGVGARSYVEALNDPESSERMRSEFREMIAGATNYRQPNVHLDGLLPYSSVSFSIHSEPFDLRTFTADLNGEVDATLMIPLDFEGGYHEIHAVAIDYAGKEVEYYEPIVLSTSETDFDGDGVLDNLDSCPTIVNLSIDENNNGIDAACEPEVTSLQDNEGEPLIKGVPSIETVAGNEQITSGAVLGVNTQKSETNVLGATLEATGTRQDYPLIVGIVLAMTAAGLLIMSLSNKKQYKHKLNK